MKVKEITRLMNDHGSNPCGKVLKHTDDCAILTYEGNSDNMDEKTRKPEH